MTRQHQNTRAIADRKHGVQVQQQTIVDDSPLPSSEELIKLKEIDPTIIEWIKQRAEKEQEARIDFNKDRMKLAKSEHNIVKTSLYLAFITVMALSIFSGLLVYNGMETVGTIFGGVSVIACVQAFLKFGRKQI